MGDLSIVTAWVGVFVMSGIVLASAAATHSWRSPPVFLGVVWLFSMVPAITAGLAPLHVLTVPLCASFVAAFALGSALVTAAATRGMRPPGAPVKLLQARLASIVFIAGALGLSAAGAYAVAGAGDPRRLLSPETWVEMAVSYSVMRYEGTETESILVRLLLACNYAGTILAGIQYAASSGAYRRVTWVPLLACVMITVITTAKAPLLLGTLGFVSGWLAWRAVVPAAEQSGDASSVRTSLLVAGVLLVVSVGSMVLRYGGSGAVDAALIIDRMQGYFVGNVYALSAWLELNGHLVEVPALGRNTFAGIFDALGMGDRVPGLYGLIAINDIAAESNVFTALRGLIEDFTLPGAIGLTFLAGFAAEVAVRRPNAATPAASLTLLVAAYLFAGWSIVVSVFAYNVMLLAMILVALALAFSIARLPE